MQQQLIDKYLELMEQLDDLPTKLAEAQADLLKEQMTVSQAKKDRDECEVTLLSSNPPQGKNAEERELAKKAMFRRSQRWNSLDTAILLHDREAQRFQNEVDALTRQYGAVCYQTRLHAALLSYLGSAGAPVKLSDVSFGMGAPGHTNGRSVEHVTEADAKALGL